MLSRVGLDPETVSDSHSTGSVHAYHLCTLHVSCLHSQWRAEVTVPAVGDLRDSAELTAVLTSSLSEASRQALQVSGVDLLRS